MSEEIKNNETEIREAIIKVVAFFNMFDYPLTLKEVWINLSVKCELVEVMKILDEMEKPSLILPLQGRQIIESRHGFYFLVGQEKNIKERLNRYSFTDRKFKRAMLASKIFKFIPWIKMIAIGNLLGAHNLKDNSDIDFFIITEDKQIWLTRFFCAGITKILGLRPRPGKSRDKICLSFYAGAKAMDLNGLMLKDKEALNNNDIYFIYWLAGLTPIFDNGGVYEKFISANLWLKEYLPNWQPVNPLNQRQVKPVLSEFYHDLASLFIGGLEPQFKELQLRWLPAQLKNLMNQDSRVVINDQIIKLHANDRREEYRNKFSETMKGLM
jgi:hypothetical protein